MLCCSTKQAARGEISGFCQQRAMVALGWLPGMAHSGEMSHCAPTRDLAVRMAQSPLTLSSMKRKGSLETQSWRGAPYYPVTELQTFMSKLNLSTQVACTTSNHQNAAPSSSCMLSVRAWVKSALAQQSILEMGCSSIQLHGRVIPGSLCTATTYPVHEIPSRVPIRQLYPRVPCKPGKGNSQLVALCGVDVRGFSTVQHFLESISCCLHGL